MAVININSGNNNSFNTVRSGRNVQIINNKVYIDDNLVDTGDSKTINISVEGDLDTLVVDYADKVSITGNVKGSASTTSGDISIGGDSGSAGSTSGDIKVKGNVTGSISTTSGDVEVGGSVGGRINTISGDISHG